MLAEARALEYLKEKIKLILLWCGGGGGTRQAMVSTRWWVRGGGDEDEGRKKVTFEATQCNTMQHYATQRRNDAASQHRSIAVTRTYLEQAVHVSIHSIKDFV